MDEALIPLIAIIALFVVLPGMVFHYITLWRRQKTLQPDDERMLEDLWRSAKAMERRIETLESLLEARDAQAHRQPPRPHRTHLDD
ncbi:phage shock protein B [Hyphomonas neptunium ATCC 15444]|uniref:Phage shock protein B n=2 Tax=Hyphomonas TaxID=85 RepID=Q0BX25_HYPNA|nr:MULTISPECIES: envelope stress response membrane protein PspB [Hyphomonas]ABI76709.1 phage shock protein B [Hyphomonas neptunium ATCC 15444]KCZ92032.1 phage shock protein B [Hyphomonas hirschiana VP5]